MALDHKLWRDFDWVAVPHLNHLLCEAGTAEAVSETGLI